jgi:hypothetical protein
MAAPGQPFTSAARSGQDAGTAVAVHDTARIAGDRVYVERPGVAIGPLLLSPDFEVCAAVVGIDGVARVLSVDCPA